MIKKKVLKKKILKKESKFEFQEFGVEWVAIDSVKLWEDNPRFNEDAAEKLAEIIKVHGIKSPIVCWDKNRTIYKGNTTYKACKLLKMDKVPVIFHSFESEIAAKAYGIADNKASEMAGWDDELLLRIMSTKEFKSSGLRESVGFEEREIELLDFWPPDQDRVKKAKKNGKDIFLKLNLSIPMDIYTEVREKVTEAIKDYKEVSLK